METKVKRREWVKTFAIVFLSVLLVLTFFSNTIMNRSLPEVAAQYVQSGSINARIRGNGTVSANEVYEVSLSQTRKVRSVLVKVGQEVTVGDPLLQLESMESEELKAAQEQLDQMELSYQKSLIEASNSSSTEDRQIQKLREDYNEALAAYRIHSSQSPDSIALLLEEAEVELTLLEQKRSELENELTKMKNDREYQNAVSELAALKVTYQTALTKYEKAKEAVDELQQLDQDIADREAQLEREQNLKIEQLYANYDIFLEIAGANTQLCANNLDYFKNIMRQQGRDETQAELLQSSYNAILPVLEMQRELPSEVERENMQRNLTLAEREKETAAQNLSSVQFVVDQHEAEQETVQGYVDRCADAVLSQQAVVAGYQKASAAAATLKAAEEALEDAVFQAGLGDSSNLDMQAAREAIDEQKALVEELTKDADGQEITANVSGVVSAINISAGGTAAAETPVVSITVADRGFTLNIPVTNDQARQVRVGDTAEITNYYWSDITATLESIAADPSSQGQGKMLVFRITGDVEAGTNLTLSIGQRSANYDCLVPNSAIRSDANGSFVLVVTSKSSPLGNRYVATRAEVQVLASDDTTSAVSGLANGDYVITTSSKPLEAGDMVRLPDNG